MSYPTGILEGCRFQSIILLIGYSTIPFAPACFRRGMIDRTMLSSTIVLRATQDGSERCETVGFWSAGRIERTAFRLSSGVFIMSPTFPSASRQD